MPAGWLGYRTELNEAELDRAVPNPYAYGLEDAVVRQQSELKRALDALNTTAPAAPVAPYTRDVTP